MNMPVATKPPAAPTTSVDVPGDVDADWASDDGWSLVDEPSVTPNREPAAGVPPSSPVLHDWWAVDDGWVLPDELALESQPAGAGARGDVRVGTRVDINTAALDELCAVPGIGKGKARAIIAWRQEHGRFASLERLADVRGFGKKTVARLAEHLTAKQP